MANSWKRNSIFIDTTGDITVDASRPVIRGILVTPSADNSRVTIKESNGGTTVIDIKILTTESRYIEFDTAVDGIDVSQTFNVTTLTNITSVILYGGFGQPIGQARG